MSYKKPRPTKHQFTVKKSYAGLGLFALTPIKRRDFVIEYWGNLMLDEDVEKKAGGKYYFDLGDTPWTIDGTLRANTARYINHSCKPNCEAIQDGKRIFIYAVRGIKPGEEITYSYGDEYITGVIGGVKNCLCGNHKRKKKS